MTTSCLGGELTGLQNHPDSGKFGTPEFVFPDLLAHGCKIERSRGDHDGNADLQAESKASRLGRTGGLVLCLGAGGCATFPVGGHPEPTAWV